LLFDRRFGGLLKAVAPGAGRSEINQ